MDSWFDLVYRILLFCGVFGIAALVFQQNRNRTRGSEKWVTQTDELMLNDAEGADTQRPVGPPPPESFD
jgi:hypothetical protein